VSKRKFVSDRECVGGDDRRSTEEAIPEGAMSETVVHIDAEYLEKFMTDVFVGLGVPAADAAVCADVLATADRRGIDSHGINRCKPIYYDRVKAGILNPVTDFEMTRETKTTAVVDGHNGMGHVVGKRCMQIAIDKAREFGMGMVAARNSTHYGIAGYYVLMAVDAGMIGVTGTNARPSIAPVFGVENMLGTNPLTFGMPTDEPFPFVIDCATSVSQRGKIEYYDRLEKNIPSGWVIDLEGNDRTDTRQVLEDLTKGAAALVPLGGTEEDTGGHKGYGYATVVEILSSALQAGNCMKALTGYSEGRRIPIELGHFFIAMDVEAFTELDLFRQRTGDILRQLRGSRKKPGHGRIYTAGEKEHEAWLERSEKGLPLPQGVQNDMVAMRDELGLKTYTFPWEK
jgi:L-2-hydroxycarboxylate dehydrogenase (NAD+)